MGDTTNCPLRTALSILADLVQIVNAQGLLAIDESVLDRGKIMNHEGREGSRRLYWEAFLVRVNAFRRSLRGEKAEDLAHHAVALIGLE